jgi:hypothetical protein
VAAGGMPDGQRPIPSAPAAPPSYTSPMRDATSPLNLHTPSRAAAVWRASDCSDASNDSVLGLLTLFDDEVGAMDTVGRISCVTHVDPRCVVSCMIVAALIRVLARGEVRDPDDMTCMRWCAAPSASTRTSCGQPWACARSLPPASRASTVTSCGERCACRRTPTETLVPRTRRSRPLHSPSGKGCAVGRSSPSSRRCSWRVGTRTRTPASRAHCSPRMVCLCPLTGGRHMRAGSKPRLRTWPVSSVSRRASMTAHGTPRRVRMGRICRPRMR